MAGAAGIWTTDAWARLKAHVPSIEGTHLRELMKVGHNRGFGTQSRAIS